MSELFKYYGIKVRKGDFVFNEGDHADALYLIHKGKIQISKDIGDLEENIIVLGEGEFIGEMGIINSMPRSANAIALEDCELIRMDKQSFEEMISQSNQFATNVIQFLSHRLRVTTEAIPVLKDIIKEERFFSALQADFLRSGKRDKAGRWYLLEMGAVIERMERKFRMSTEAVIEMLGKFGRQDLLAFKKDHNGDSWIAFDVKSE